MNAKFLLLVMVCSCALAVEKTSYEGYKLVNIFPENETHLKLLSELQHNPDVCHKFHLIRASLIINYRLSFFF